MAAELAARSGKVSALQYASQSGLHLNHLDKTDGAGPRDALILELRGRIADIVARPAGWQRSMPDPIPEAMLDPATAPTVSSPRASGPAQSSMAAPRSVCPFLPAGLAVRPSELSPPLTFGIEAIDARLPAGGLQPHGLHEFKPRTARDAGSALALALSLAARRSNRHAALPGVSGPPLLMVLAGRAGAEHGLPYGPGLHALGLDPGRLLIVTAARPADALWAIEEGLRIRALGAVIASIETAGMLAARRLVLAASEGGTPCFMLTGPGKAGIGVAHTRWRIGSLASAPHPLEPSAPGAWRCALSLERCRQGPSDLAWTLEWCDASHSFGLATGVSAAAVAAAGAWRRTG